MEFGIGDFLKLAGSLGLFIYGMMVMSDGIQKVAGKRMRDIIGSMTSNRFKGVLTGFGTTAIIQSSSATTVMIVSFVNVGLMRLRQAIGVIMGANIGTTMTAWIIVFVGFKISLGAYMFPLLAIAVPLLFFTTDRARSTGEFLIGFALLFIGLDEMKHTVEALHLEQNEVFHEFILNLAGGGIGPLLLFILIGTILTITVQSSSAAMALTLTFTESGLPLEMAAAIVLGENIGTTITANLAAIVGNVHAKRAARAHFMFNVFGVLWMILVFPWFLQMIDYIMTFTPWGSPLAANSDPESVRYGLALFHTTFNVVNTLILIWFVKFIEKAAIAITPARNEDDEQFRLEYIGSNVTSTSEFGLLNAKKEIVKFADVCRKMGDRFKEMVNETDKKKIKRLADKIYMYEDITDRIDQEVAVYLTRMSEKDMTMDSSQRVRAMISIANDLEKVGDVYYQMTKSIIKKQEDKIWFNQKQRENINLMLDKVQEALDDLAENLDQKLSLVRLDHAMEIENELNELRDKIRRKHLKHTEKGEYKLDSGMIYSNLFNSIERIGDLIFAAAEANAGRNLA